MYSLLALILAFLFPAAPKWVPDLIMATVEVVGEIVEDLKDHEDKAERLHMAVVGVHLLLDEKFDDIPEWAELGEAKRDRILAGAVELVLWLSTANIAGDLNEKGVKRLKFLLRFLAPRK